MKFPLSLPDLHLDRATRTGDTHVALCRIEGGPFLAVDPDPLEVRIIRHGKVGDLHVGQMGGVERLELVNLALHFRVDFGDLTR